ncbi:ATP-binding protein [Ideonella sp. BN130291]|uniref:ATP-binding protein n=1 Tax=Ideonella sp. BN130291 TaxID=3112940 RepID=UPI002E268870|nr:ATP-binding protein [Ideonella sp. BN130291]
MQPHLDIPVREPSQVGEARRAAARLAAEVALNEVDAGRLALVVTELGTNLARHASQGRILLGCHSLGGQQGVDVLSLDEGPGMADVGQCLRDGYTTGGTPGTGLGAVQRLADEFSVFSQPGQGSVIVARVMRRTPAGAPGGAPPAFEVGAVCLPAPGETVSGDGWALATDGDRAGVVVVDGLGHGPQAAEASDAALAVFRGANGRSPSDTLTLAHGAMRSTRGAAMAMARLDASAGTLVFSGAGNIAGRIISGVGDRSLMSQHGTVGLQIRRLQDMHYAWPAAAALVLHSDGLVTRWDVSSAPGLLQCHPLAIAGWLVRHHVRGRDDATVVVVRRR